MYGNAPSLINFPASPVPADVFPLSSQAEAAVKAVEAASRVPPSHVSPIPRHSSVQGAISALNCAKGDAHVYGGGVTCPPFLMSRLGTVIGVPRGP